MKLPLPITIAGIFVTAVGGYVVLGGIGFKSILGGVDAHACDNQAFDKMMAARAPTNGDISYNKDTGLCIYAYTDSNQQPAELTWVP